jgi:hypothetical protein
MTYQIIQPPFTLKFREMSKQELEDYFVWFQNILPQRLDILMCAAQQKTEFEIWQPDFTPLSLDLLGMWFAAEVETRVRTSDEFREIERLLPFPIDIPREDLTNRTFSLAIDIGMYLSQVLIKNHPGLEWRQQFRNKKDADYGQPVLVGFGQVPFNPVSIVVTLAYGIASKKKTGKNLRQIYDIWSKMVDARGMGH